MSALSLFDYFASGDGRDALRSSGSDRAGRAVRRLIESSLRQLAEINAHDEEIGQSYGDGQFDERVAVIVRAMYEDWASSARQVLGRVEVYERLGSGRLPEAEPLRDGYGRVQAMLSASLADIAEGMEQVKRGEAMSLQEVRDALHARTRA